MSSRGDAPLEKVDLEVGPASRNGRIILGVTIGRPWSRGQKIDIFIVSTDPRYNTQREETFGSVLDRINRFKKRRVLRDEVNYGLLKDLRKQIVHEYILDETDRVVVEVLNYAPLLEEMLSHARAYCNNRQFMKSV